MTKVKIVRTRCPDKRETRKLKKVLPILREYARLWNVSIAVDVPHYREQAMIKGSHLCIHFDSRPPTCYPRWFRTVPNRLSSVFGHELPETVRDVLMRSRDPQSIVVVSPEGDAIAEVLPRNIYILFDLTHRRFDQQGVILEQILDEAIPIALLGNQTSEKTKTIQSLVAKRHRRRFIGNLSKTREEFVEFWMRPVMERFDDVIKTMHFLRKEHEEAYQKLARAHHERELLIQQLTALNNQSVSAENIAREFEMILKMKEIRAVRLSGPYITVFTHKIFNGDCDLGEYLIQIPYGELKEHRQIRFMKGKDRGTHSHVHAQPLGGTCFGQELNWEMDKLCQEGDFFRIIQLCIIFLEEETTPPFIDGTRGIPFRRFPLPSGEESIDPLAGETVNQYPDYTSPEDRALEKQKFVEVVSNFRSVSIRNTLYHRVTLLGDEIARVEKTFREKRNKLQCYLELKDLMEKKFLPQIRWLQDVFNNLTFQVIEIKVRGHYCQFLFLDADHDLVRLYLDQVKKMIWASPSTTRRGEMIKFSCRSIRSRSPRRFLTFCLPLKAEAPEKIAYELRNLLLGQEIWQKE